MLGEWCPAKSAGWLRDRVSRRPMRSSANFGMKQWEVVLGEIDHSSTEIEKETSDDKDGGACNFHEV